MRQLSPLYEAILKSFGAEIDHQGRVSLRAGDDVSPMMIGEKRLVVPSTELMRTLNWSESMVAFHPIDENILLDESPVLRITRRIINFRLSSVISILLSELAAIAADPSKHKQLSPAASEFLELVPNVDGDTVKRISEIIDVVDPFGEKRFVNVYVKRGAIINGQNYVRGAIVTFPFVEEFTNEEHVMYGVDLRKKDKEAIIALFRYLLPKSDTPHGYSFGTREQVAPTFHAIAHAFINVAKPLNRVTDRLKKNLGDDMYNYLHIDTSWEDDIASLAGYRGQFPSLPENEGTRGPATNSVAQATQRQSDVAKHLSDGVKPLNIPTTAPAAAVPQFRATDGKEAVPAGGDVVKPMDGSMTSARQFPKPIGMPIAEQIEKNISTPTTQIDDAADWQRAVYASQARMAPPLPQFQVVGRPAPVGIPVAAPAAYAAPYGVTAYGAPPAVPMTVFKAEGRPAPEANTVMVAGAYPQNYGQPAYGAPPVNYGGTYGAHNPPMQTGVVTSI